MSYAACTCAVARLDSPELDFAHTSNVYSADAIQTEFRASWIRYNGMWEKRDWQSAEPRNDDNNLSTVLSSLTDCSKAEGCTICGDTLNKGFAKAA